MRTLLSYLWFRMFFPKSRAFFEWHMLVLLNGERRKHRLPALVMEQDLRRVARKHSKDMALSGYFSHTNQANQSPADRIQMGGISDTNTGENLAFVQGYAHPTVQAMKGLMDSPGHRENILRSSYTGVGIGVYMGKQGKIYYTQNFVRRLFRSFRGPRWCKVGNPLTITGVATRTLKSSKLFMQVKRYGQVVEETMLANADRLRFPYTPTQSGIYTFAVYTLKAQQGTLVNQCEVRVTSSLLTRLFSR